MKLFLHCFHFIVYTRMNLHAREKIVEGVKYKERIMEEEQTNEPTRNLKAIRRGEI